MRVFVLAALGALLACLSPASARLQDEQPLQWLTLVQWQPDEGSRTYVNGDLRLTIASSEGGDPDDHRALLTVRRPGMAPITIRGSAGRLWRFGIGRIDARVKTPAILLQTFTGGAHCCSVIDVAVPEAGQYRIVELRRRGPDGRTNNLFNAALDQFPVDLSGDGIADFVLTDDAFLYRFSSYAGSLPPPLVLNIVGGQTVDVSKSPRLRPLFAIKMAEARGYCTTPSALESERNGACAGYVADAARIGQLEAAWKVMLAHYDRGSTWNKKPFPADLKDFLRANGYIR